MRPNNLTRCIFKSTVQNECRIRNKAKVYKHIHQHKTNFKSTHQQRIKKATMYMRISNHSLLGAKTHVRPWPTVEVASSHLCPRP